jgi:ubiquitin-conjugating enzyme E2 S
MASECGGNDWSRVPGDVEERLGPKIDVEGHPNRRCSWPTHGGRRLTRRALKTISCLLIHPNPDSALNAAAGKLLQEDYGEFARRACLMTSIHAPIPAKLRAAVMEARSRGEENKPTGSTPNGMRIRPDPVLFAVDESDNESDYDDEATASKENDPPPSPSPIGLNAPLPPRRPILGKRPLSDLPTPSPTDDDPQLSPSERNIAANTPNLSSDMACMTVTADHSQRRSTKLAERDRGINLAGPSMSSTHRGRDNSPAPKRVCPGWDKGKENLTDGGYAGAMAPPALPQARPNPAVGPGVWSTSSGTTTATRVAAVGGVNANIAKSAKPRTGLRRL